MRRLRRVVLGGLAATAVWMVSCRDIPAPDEGVAAISQLFLPSPGLVAGDTMRDSLGLVAPLKLIAYATDGTPITTASAPVFVVLDTGAHIATDLMIGDNAGLTVHVIGGIGALQTKPEIVKVTVSPDTLVAADSVVHHKRYTTPPADTIVLSADLSALVQHLPAKSGVEAVIVRYVIDRMPADNGLGKTIVLTSGNLLSDRDTTDINGKASRTARLRLGALTSLGTTSPETTAVTATASYRGRTLGTVQFIVVFEPVAP